MSALIPNPFEGERKQGNDAGARAMQAGESSMVLALIASAKREPRDVVAAFDRIRNAFTRPTLAEKATYEYSRGGSDITGPSIRAAEAISQQWSHMRSGWREISRSVDADGVGVSEVEAFAIDYEAGNHESISFFVRHWRDTKKGGYKLTDERDVYETCANQAARRKRACILALLPGDVVEAAMEQAALTLKTSVDVTPEGVRKIVDAFEQFGVTKEMIEKRIQRRLDAIQPAQVVQLKRIYASLRDDMSTPAEWFDVPKIDQPGAPAPKLDELIARGRSHKKKVSATPPAATAAPTPEQSPAPLPVAKLSEFVEGVEKAPDAEEAGLIVDRGRSSLPPEDYEKLQAIYRTKWGV